MDDAYLRSRIDDIDQVIGRVHAALHRRDGDVGGVAGEILVADTSPRPNCCNCRRKA